MENHTNMIVLKSAHFWTLAHSDTAIWCGGDWIAWGLRRLAPSISVHKLDAKLLLLSNTFPKA